MKREQRYLIVSYNGSSPELFVLDCDRTGAVWTAEHYDARRYSLKEAAMIVSTCAHILPNVAIVDEMEVWCV